MTITLLCLPCAGASATMYLRWRRLLPHGIELLPVELPGRGSRLGERVVEDFEVLVAQLCEELANAMQTAPAFAFFGHSMGALLAHGMARHLQANDQRLPVAIVASGSAAPSRRDVTRLRAALSDDASLAADLRRQGGTPEELFEHPELLRMTLDVLAADYRVCDSFRHVPRPPLPLPIHVFAGRQDDIAPDRLAAWGLESDLPLTLDWFDGGHFFIRQQEAAALAALARHLAAQSPTSDGRQPLDAREMSATASRRVLSPSA
ncbi:thioesterase II family protein [Roseateles amylovorans]|uniref:Alpha/beta fold hydrolase n=1 Tax=Roseateles amylovorans TaxID=2978473 RepID=A0ABY6AV23_9BURK|nr:alpha/beta fold hydrolase [Roseateles amylovorans]UXH76224.1 alpha/beta fold hydrolase [Roseateles amylovorans]